MEKGIKGRVSYVETIIQSIIAKSPEKIIYDKSYEMTKPTMYNIWIIVDKKITTAEAGMIIKKLIESNFCKLSEMKALVSELCSFQKIRLAILPKNCIDIILNDMKLLLKPYDMEFVLNEFNE